MPAIAISKDFLEALSKIPKSEQKKVREFTDKFSADPTQASINYEPIHDMKDSKVRTVRIGLDYRAIVIHPPKGNIYLLAWVDHHDEAMRWAKNKKFDINQYTGAIQVYDTEYVKVAEPINVEESVKKTSLFHQFSDKDLRRIGVPEILLPAIRSLQTEDQLDDIQKHLPSEVAEGLLMLAAGYSVEDTLLELEQRTTQLENDPDDFEKALEHPDSKRRFIRIQSSEELRQLLEAPLEHWRVFLHPSQESLVKGDYNGPVRILGGAGTGKTVVAMHRAKYLVEHLYPQSTDKILFLTYTSNLAKVISSQLDSIVGPKERDRIEVTTIHSLANRILSDSGKKFKTVNKDTQKEIESAWKLALTHEELNMDHQFYVEEWEEVIQQNDIQNEHEYLKVLRIGRGTGLTRTQRRQIWKVLESYRRNLYEKGIIEWIGIVREARRLIEKKAIAVQYRSVLIDEGQDLHPEDYRLIRCIVSEGKNDIFIVGDTYQRIYKNKVVLSKCGIHIRGQRSKQLNLNYRTTEEIRNWAVKVLDNEEVDDLDGGTASQEGYRSLLHGPEPDIRFFHTQEEELLYIKDYINSAILEGIELSQICIVARSNSLLEKVYAPMLNEDKTPFVILNPQISDQGEGVRLATMHRVKGLEFSHVLMVSMNEGIIPPKKILDRAFDSIARKSILMREKSLLYVAATRARDHLLVTSYNEISSLIKPHV